MTSYKSSSSRLDPIFYVFSNARFFRFIQIWSVLSRQKSISPGNVMELFEIGLVDDMENLQATLLVTVTPTLASSGQTVGTICIGQDITKLKDGLGLHEELEFGCGKKHGGILAKSRKSWEGAVLSDEYVVI